MKHTKSSIEHRPVNPSSLDPLNDSRVLYRHDGAVVRFDGDFGFNKPPEKKKVEVFEGLKKARQLFEELEEKYHIKTAGFHPAVVHHRNRDIGGMIVSRHIEGERLDPTHTFTDAQKQAARSLFGKLTEYLIEKRSTGQPFLSDIGAIEQYRYVPEASEFELVDTNAYFEEDKDSERIFIDDLTSWGSVILSPDELSGWHEDMVSRLEAKDVAA